MPRRLAAEAFRAQPCIACSGGGDIELADDQAKLLRLRDHVLDMRLALVLVGGQDGPGHPGLFHQQQFPDQICGVPDAGAHALAEKRRHLVRAIPEKEYPIAVPLRRHQGMKAVDRRSPQLDGVDIDETREHLAHPRFVLKFLRLLVRQDFQFPSPQVARAGDRTGGARRPAILRVHLGQRRGPPLPRIHDDPPLVEGEVFMANPELSAHEAVGAVTGQEISRPDRAGLRLRQS